MSEFDLGKINIKYKDNIGITAPVLDRKYTITHSDSTGELFITVGLSFDYQKVNPIRDEVLLEWIIVHNSPVLYGQVLVDGEGISGNSKLRNDIFLKELPKVLQNIRQKENRLFELYPELGEAFVWIEFKSELPEYHNIYNFGKINDYQ